MPGMWPNHGYHPLKFLFVVRYCTAPHLTLTHNFSGIRLDGPGGRIDPIDAIGPLAERKRRSPHDQAEPGFELATFCLERWCLTNCATWPLKNRLKIRRIQC